MRTPCDGVDLSHVRLQGILFLQDALIVDPSGLILKSNFIGPWKSEWNEKMSHRSYLGEKKDWRDRSP